MIDWSQEAKICVYLRSLVDHQVIEKGAILMSPLLYYETNFIVMYLLTALRFLKFMGKIYAVYPLDESAERIWGIFYKFLWWFYFVNCVTAAAVALMTCYVARKDFTIATFAWMEFVSMMEAIIILINYKYYHSLLKLLLIEAEDYISVADIRRESVLKEKAIAFTIMMILITLLYSVLVVLYFTEPAITSWDSLLTTAYYPPTIRSSIFDIFLYFHQIVVMFHTSVMVNLDAMIVLLIYICSVRFKILAIDFKQPMQYEELKECIQEHQFILCLAKQINYAVQMVVSKTVLCFIMYTVGAGLQITNPEATTTSLQRFGVVLLINYLRLIMNATSADELTAVSLSVGNSVYSTNWYEADKDLAFTKFIIMTRCQKIVKIYSSGIMPALNLAYITGIISTSLSYFTTLRAITSGS